MVTPHVEYLAHHYLLLAAPAFLPAVIVVAVILYIALRDAAKAATSQAPPRPPPTQRNPTRPTKSVIDGRRIWALNKQSRTYLTVISG